MDRPPPAKWFDLCIDDILSEEQDEVYTAWKSSVLGRPLVMKELEAFVSTCIPHRGAAHYVNCMEGSFNQVFRLSFELGGSDVAFRVPKPGHSAADLVDEKVANEANWMEYLRGHTAIPIPRVYRCGRTADNPTSIGGPFILMDFIEGVSLRDKFRDISSDPTKLKFVYAQVADIYLQLYDLRFDAIGSITKDPSSGKWAITRRPLTYDMHELVMGVPDYPIDMWPTEPFRHSADYLDFVTAQHQCQLRTLRNINIPPKPDPGEGEVDLDDRADKVARLRFKARKAIAELAWASLLTSDDDDDGSFAPFNPDLDPRNMLVDVESGRITGIIDLEFMNTMPTRFATGSPLWLKIIMPWDIMNAGYFPWFLHEFECPLMQFLGVLKDVEEARSSTGSKRKRSLSTLMLRSWQSKRCWVDCALNYIDRMDAMYWGALHNTAGIPVLQLSREEEDEMEEYVRFSREQISRHKQLKASRWFEAQQRRMKEASLG